MSEPIHIISLGAGVQSSTMAKMADVGEIEPMPHSGVFADTKWEPLAVYKALAWLRKNLSFEVAVVSKGDLGEVALKIRTKKDGSGQWAKTVVPTYILNSDGTRGIVQRQCTYDFKLAEITKYHRRVIGKIPMQQWRLKHRTALRALFEWEIECASCRKIKSPQPVRPEWAWRECQDNALSIAWIGISLDEAALRAKESKQPWIKNRWPLIEARMTRWDCLRWMEKRGFPKPPRSACVFCPYHNDNEWRRMRDESPAEFQKAVNFERRLQAVKRETDNMDGVPFLHDSLKPLDQVDFSTEEERGQTNLFNNECEGMCGV